MPIEEAANQRAEAAEKRAEERQKAEEERLKAETAQAQLEQLRKEYICWKVRKIISYSKWKLRGKHFNQTFCGVYCT